MHQANGPGTGGASWSSEDALREYFADHDQRRNGHSVHGRHGKANGSSSSNRHAHSSRKRPKSPAYLATSPVGSPDLGTGLEGKHAATTTATAKQGGPKPVAQQILYIQVGLDRMLGV